MYVINIIVVQKSHREVKNDRSANYTGDGFPE